MHVLILGAAGMLGRKLAAAIAGGELAATRLTLADVVEPPAPSGLPVRRLTLSLTDRAATTLLLDDRPDVIFHLAAVVSGEAEADLDRGLAVNLDATRGLLDAIRRVPRYRPKVIFASSIAVFGPPFPAVIPDDFAPVPATSYGTQKLMVEALLTDYTRRGLIDGVSLRLPTICIRPGAANRAASGFFSAILREPLAGQPAILPVRADLAHWFASPRAATGFFLQAARMDLGALGRHRALTLPGLRASVQDLIDALAATAGPAAAALIEHHPDPRIAAIVETWPEAFAATRARALGFTAETRAQDLIDAYLADDAP